MSNPHATDPSQNGLQNTLKNMSGGKTDNERENSPFKFAHGWTALVIVRRCHSVKVLAWV